MLSGAFSGPEHRMHINNETIKIGLVVDLSEKWGSEE
jgi:hypothetical protein